MKDAPHRSSPPGNGPGYEVSDIRVGLPVIAGLVLLTITAVAAVLMVVMFDVLDERGAAQDELPSPMAQARELPPGPRLQPDPSRELQALRAYEETLLTGYGWADRENGFVRMPVERAMDLLLERGVPVRKPPGEGK